MSQPRIYCPFSEHVTSQKIFYADGFFKLRRLSNIVDKSNEQKGELKMKMSFGHFSHFPLFLKMR